MNILIGRNRLIPALVLVLLALASPVSAQTTWTSGVSYAWTVQGGLSSLPAIAGVSINPGSTARVYDSGGTVYQYRAVFSGTTVNNSPYRISPSDLQAGGTGSGVSMWELQGLAGDTVFARTLVIDATTVRPQDVAGWNNINSQVTNYVQSQVSQYPYATQVTSWIAAGTSTFLTGNTAYGPGSAAQLASVSAFGVTNWTAGATTVVLGPAGVSATNVSADNISVAGGYKESVYDVLAIGPGKILRLNAASYLYGGGAYVYVYDVNATNFFLAQGVKVIDSASKNAFFNLVNATTGVSGTGVTVYPTIGGATSFTAGRAGVSATNVQADRFIGDGSQLTGLAGGGDVTAAMLAAHGAPGTTTGTSIAGVSPWTGHYLSPNQVAVAPGMAFISAGSGDSCYMVMPYTMVMTGVSLIVATNSLVGVSIHYSPSGGIPATNGSNGLADISMSGTSVAHKSGTTRIAVGSILNFVLKPDALPAGASVWAIQLTGRKE